MDVRFFVAGLPKSMRVGGVARFQKGDKVHMVPKRGNTEWAILVGQIGRAHAPATVPQGPVRFQARFFMPRPQAARKAAYPLKRPDLDNLLHKLTDQFNGVFWTDDSQVVDVVASKRFAGADGRVGVEIIIVQLSAEDDAGVVVVA